VPQELFMGSGVTLLKVPQEPYSLISPMV